MLKLTPIFLRLIAASSLMLGSALAHAHLCQDSIVSPVDVAASASRLEGLGYDSSVALRVAATHPEIFSRSDEELLPKTSFRAIVLKSLADYNPIKTDFFGAGQIRDIKGKISQIVLQNLTAYSRWALPEPELLLNDRILYTHPDILYPLTHVYSAARESAYLLVFEFQLPSFAAIGKEEEHVWVSHEYKTLRSWVPDDRPFIKRMGFVNGQKFEEIYRAYVRAHKYDPSNPEHAYWLDGNNWVHDSIVWFSFDESFDDGRIREDLQP